MNPKAALFRPAVRRGPLERVGLVTFAVLLALVVGLASVFLPAWFVVSVLVVPAVLVLLLVRPEYGLVASIGLVCDLVHPALIPRVPVLGGSLAAGDAMLVILVLYAAWSFAAQAGRKPLPAVAGGRLLLTAAALFGLSLAVSVALSILVMDLTPTVVLGEARDLLYLFALPVALVILRPPRRQERFVVGMVVLGCLFAAGQILQGIFNIPVFGSAGMSTLETLGVREYSTTRSNTHGLSIIIFALLLVVGAYVLDNIRKPVFVLAFGLLLMGILLTFGRTTFAAVAVCVFMVVAWLDVRKLPRLVGVLALLLLVVVLLGSLFKPASVQAAFYRLTSITAEINHGYSAGWRFMEIDAMLPHIVEHPLTGIGLGADYKGISGSSSFPDLNRYMHNAYLYMAGKMGLPALALFLLMMGSIFAIGRRLARGRPAGTTPAWARIVGAAGAAMMLRFVLASVTEPHLMSDHGVVTIAVIGALVYLAAQRAAPRLDAAAPARAAGRVAPRRYDGQRRPTMPWP